MQKIHFITQGCSANMAETEIMQGLIVKAGYELVNEANEADVNVVNICTVKGNSTALKQIREIKNGRKMIITGCITSHIIPEIRKIDPDASLVTTHNICQIVDVVEETVNGNIIEAIEKDPREKVCLPRVRRNPVIGITPILNSCSSFCTFCSTRLVKGKLYSYPLEHIKADINTALNEGCKEIWLTSQDNSAYNIDRTGKCELPKLINKILNINKKFYLRIGMMNPSDLIPVLDELIECYQDPRIFKFAHIPVQSGNDEILEKMKRRYVLDDFLLIIKEMKRKIKNLTLATDIIVGFPTETDGQFYDSVNLIKEIEPDLLHISRFQKREGTLAARMPQLAGGILKDRSRIMTDVFNEITKKKNEEWIGWKGKVLIDEFGKNNTMVGRNFAYKPVIVKSGNLGEEIEVEIKEAARYDLRDFSLYFIKNLL